jgi:hypothetical protein
MLSARGVSTCRPPFREGDGQCPVRVAAEGICFQIRRGSLFWDALAGGEAGTIHLAAKFCFAVAAVSAGASLHPAGQTESGQSPPRSAKGEKIGGALPWASRRSKRGGPVSPCPGPPRAHFGEGK